LAVAFGVFANQGIKVPLHSILKVEDSNQQILEDYNPDAATVILDNLNRSSENSDAGLTRVISRETAYLISHILLDNNARSGAFGSSSQLVIRNKTVSVKTGTTNDLRDNWTIGYTPNRLVAVWVGNNDNTPMHPYLVSGITGAAPIWHSLMERTLKDQPDRWPEKPEGIIGLEVCTLSGLIPNPEKPCSTRFEFFNKKFQPREFDRSRREIWIKKDTGLPPQEGDFENIELQEHTVLSDPLQVDFCLDCPWTQETDEQGQPNGKISYPQFTVNSSPTISP
jgi:membrane carboxypeptidase/penicillin-binding protein